MSTKSTGKTSRPKTHKPQQPASQPRSYDKTGLLKYGNKDSKQKYDLSSLNVRDDNYVVRHFGYMTNAKGQNIEDESTNRFQVYDKDTFKRLNEQGKKDGKQQESVFEQQGLGVDVLHEPE